MSRPYFKTTGADLIALINKGNAAAISEAKFRSNPKVHDAVVARRVNKSLSAATRHAVGSTQGLAPEVLATIVQALSPTRTTRKLASDTTGHIEGAKAPKVTRTPKVPAPKVEFPPEVKLAAHRAFAAAMATAPQGHRKTAGWNASAKVYSAYKASLVNA